MAEAHHPEDQQKAPGVLGRAGWLMPLAVGLLCGIAAFGIVVFFAMREPASSTGITQEPTGSIEPTGPTREVFVLVRDGDTERPLAGMTVDGGDTSGRTNAKGECTVTATRGQILRAWKAGWLQGPGLVATETTSLVLEPFRWAYQWMKFGYDPQRTAYNPYFTDAAPYKVAWKYKAKSLLEYPVSVFKGRIVGVTGRGKIFRLNAKNGRELWKRELGVIFAAQPTVDGTRAYVGAMNRVVYAVDLTRGKTDWTFDTGGPVESSPVLDENRLFIGSWNRSMYCLNRDTGKVIWRFETGGAVKGSPAISGTRLYFGSYDGNLYCVDKRNGHLKWRAAIGGTVYSSPGVGDGRVYVGSTAGYLVCLDAASGGELWSFQTGNTRFGVYSSPALAHGNVYFGSYDGTFYACDAGSGALRWTFNAGGAVSGSPAVIGKVVYLASFGGHAYALDAKSGRLIHTFPDGRYTPASANGEFLFIAGRKILYAYRTKRTYLK